MRQSRVQRRSRAQKAGIAALVATALLTVAACGSGSGGAAEEFPSRITFVVPFEAGGGTDTWARILAPKLEKVLPGSPSIRVENLPSGKGIPANNEFYNRAKDDGSRILVGTSSSYNPYLLHQKGVEYDFAKLRPVVAMGTGSVIYASKASGIKSIQDMIGRSTPAKYGAINQTGADLGALVAFEMLGIHVDATFGFEGRGPISLAFQRGELDVDRQTTSAYISTVQPLVDKGEVVPLATYGVIDEKGEIVRDPNFPDLPTVAEVYEQIKGSAPSGPAWDAYKVFAVAGYTYQKTLWATPGTPDSILDAYTDAVKQLQNDEEFMKKLHEEAGDYPLVAGDTNRDVIQRSFTVTDEAGKFVSNLLAEKYDTQLD
ncbi:Bug family tripartite tricarboxylate transporter substrate binding protein [Micromonospora sp. NPDC005087]|uniref:Bug family tripartite tricarboxylate transporter substrate binding protein n=1 Tax=Micromonospora sp. NPDC005087 TaxID=3364225 RepID=UPI0036B0AD68